jgi:hypothetical protein
MMDKYKVGQEVMHNGDYYRITQIISWLGENKKIIRLRRFDEKKRQEIVVDVAEANINKKIPKKKKPILGIKRESIYDLLEVTHGN